MKRVLFACVTAALLVLAVALFPAFGDDDSSGWIVRQNFLTYHQGDIITDPAVIADLESRGFIGERWYLRFGPPIAPIVPAAGPTNLGSLASVNGGTLFGGHGNLLIRGNDQTANYNTVVKDGSGNLIGDVNNQGRLDLYSGYAGIEGAIIALYNRSVGNNHRGGHFAFGAPDQFGNLNTIGFTEAYIIDNTASAIQSSITLAYMNGVNDGSPGSYAYQQPNQYLTVGPGPTNGTLITSFHAGTDQSPGAGTTNSFEFLVPDLGSLSNYGGFNLEDAAHCGLSMGFDNNVSENWSYLYSRCQGTSLNSLAFYTNNGSVTVPQMLITATTGTVEIGLAAPRGGAKLDVNGLVGSSGAVSNGTTFTIASGCGTPGSLTGGPTTGSFTAGQAACAPVINLPTAPNGWVCTASDLTHPADVFTQTAKATNSCTLSATVTSADVIVIHAEGY